MQAQGKKVGLEKWEMPGAITLCQVRIVLNIILSIGWQSVFYNLEINLFRIYVQTSYLCLILYSLALYIFLVRVSDHLT